MPDKSKSEPSKKDLEEKIERLKAELADMRNRASNPFALPLESDEPHHVEPDDEG
jgi:hypothetical protein